MKQHRRSLVRRIVDRFSRALRAESRQGLRRRVASQFEPLEPRLALTISSPLPPVTGAGAHIHPVLSIFIDGQQVVIPPSVGLNATDDFSPHTHDFTGTLHIGEGGTAGISGQIRNTNLQDFFDVWRTINVGQASNNPSAVFDTDLGDDTPLPRILDKTVDAGHVLRMYVKEAGDSAPELEYASNAATNDLTRPELYVPRDHDQIYITYETLGDEGLPSLAPLHNVVVNGGSAQWVALDGFDPNGGPLTYTVTANSNPGLLTTTIPTGNHSLVMSVAGAGVMKFQLFENMVPRVTSRIIDLVNSGFYDDTATNTITFHRIINDFVIQAGDPTGTGSGGSTLGPFDDQFNIDLQHNRSGLLSMAKSSDDTNDSQFFITEERNESQFVTLTGSPTGGSFTLTYFDQTTEPIAFNNSGDFTAIANSIKTALENLTRIGPGNVVVTHDPVLNSSNQVTENRRWRVDFVNALGHQEVVNLTGNAAGLTGGTSPNIAFDEIKSARHLDFNHSIFGLLTEGEVVRDAISNVATNSSGVPTNPPVISNIDVIVDQENGALLLKAAEGASGEGDITVRVTDQNGNFSERTFHVIVTPDGFDGAPFLNDIAPVRGVTGQQIQLQLIAQDVENSAKFFDAVKPSGNTVNYTLSVNNNTGLVTMTPPAGFIGTFNVLVGVRGAVQSDTGDQFDTQQVAVTVAPTAPTGVDLLAASDTGFSNSDNITNASTLQFQVSGVTSGATVRLKRGATTLSEGTASGATITLNVTNLGSFGEGLHTLRATQVVNGIESDLSTPLDVTLDTTPPGAFTTTPPTEASADVPLAYDADAPGEGTAGFVFSLAAAPTGVTINGVTGELSWTPVSSQLGQHVFQIVATDAAGNATQQTLNITVDDPIPDKIEITLGLTDTNGSPISGLDSNQNFVLHVFVEDIRDTAFGVASIYFDIFFDPTRAEVTGPIAFVSPYQLFQSGSATTPGLIDELGAFGSISGPVGAGKFELASIPMKAKQSGQLTFVTDPTDDNQAHPAAVYLQNEEVTFQEIRFGTASITVDPTFQAVNDSFNVNEDSQNQTLNPLVNDTIDPGSGNVLTIQSVGATNHGGTLQIAADAKSLKYTPAHDFFGTETFTYTIKNQNNETSTATIAVQVQPQNDPPTAVDDPFNVPEDSQNFVLDVLANDSFAPDAGETLKVTAVTQPATGGTAAVGPSGNSVSFTPAQNFVGQTSFTYTLSDGHGGTDTATVTVTVTETNDNPTATNDTPTVTEDSTGNILNVLSNDSFAPDTNETLTVTGVTTPSHGGTATVGENGANVVYTPAGNFQGVETFSYTISDGRGGTATGIVTVTVTNTNDPPTANNDTLNAFKNTATVLDVLANDSSVPDPAEAFTIDTVTQPAHGTVQITNGGTRVTYTPTTDYTGPDTFTYTMKDPGGLASQTATVNLTVQEFIPSTLAGFVYFDVDNDGVKDAAESPLAGVTITLTGTDINSAAVNRTLKTASDGSYKFDNLAPGSYTLTETQPSFTIDGKDTAGSQGGTTAQNDKVVIQLAQNTNGVNNNFGERGRQATLITIRDFFASSSRNYITAALDSTGAELWHSSKGSPFQPYTNPVLTLLNSATQLKVEGTSPQSQPVSATLPLTDPRIRMLGQSGNNRLIQVASFDLANPTNNHSPTAVANQYSTNEDTALTVPVATGVLANDTDPDQNTLTAAVVTQPQHGTLTLNANGSFTYTPANNFNGSDSFTYRASDSLTQSQPATVTITVNPVNDTPAAVANQYSTTQNTALTTTLANGVLANDTDAEGSTLTAAVATQPQHGTLSLATNGTFTYTPTTGFTGTDSFTYRASDGAAQSQPATVTITVDPPGGGEGEAPASTAAAQALLAYLASTDEQSGGGVGIGQSDWQAAVDQVLGELGQ